MDCTKVLISENDRERERRGEKKWNLILYGPGFRLPFEWTKPAEKRERSISFGATCSASRLHRSNSSYYGKGEKKERGVISVLSGGDKSKGAFNSIHTRAGPRPDPIV